MFRGPTEFEMLQTDLKPSSVSHNEISSQGASMIFSTLAGKTTMSKVSISHNRIDGECLSSLANFLNTTPSLSILDLGCNKFSDDCMKTMASSLSGNTSLNAIILCGNRRITDQSIPALKSLFQNTHIDMIDVSRSSVKNSKVMHWMMNLRKCFKDMHHLNLASKLVGYRIFVCFLCSFVALM